MHDFKNFPELTNNQMQVYYFESPHKQITEDFDARVVKVTDGDTIRVTMNERNFDFPIRIADLAAPERDEVGGKESASWLTSKILGEEVQIQLTKQRVEKWGRLLAHVIFFGMNIATESIELGHAKPWEKREKAIPEVEKWF